MKKIAILLAFALSAVIAFADDAITINNSADGASSISINQDLDSFTFTSNQWGDRRFVENRVGAYVKSASGTVTDLGYFGGTLNATDLKSGDSIGFYLNDIDGMYYNYSLTEATDGSLKINFDRDQFATKPSSLIGNLIWNWGSYIPVVHPGWGWIGGDYVWPSGQHRDDWVSGGYDYTVSNGAPLPGVWAVILLGMAGLGAKRRR